MPPAAVARRPRCRASTPAARRATRACAIRPTRRRSRRSSPSCAPPATTLHGQRLRGLIVVLWRAGLRISEALALAEADLDPRRGAVLVRRGKGGRRREVGMDDWAWEQLQPWLDRAARAAGRPAVLRHHRPDARPALVGRAPPAPSCAAPPRGAGVRRRFAPHQLRHAHAVEMAREGVPLIVIQRQLGHSNLGITSIYLQGIDNAEIIDTVHARRAPMVPVDATLRL